MAPSIKITSQRLLWNTLAMLGHPIAKQDLGRPAIVFSPHPDDETLGCGGTIIQKIKARAEVKIVFMTDGSESHRRFVSGQELTEIRAREAISACKILGVQERDIFFLGFKDGYLDDHSGSAIEKVKKILSRECYEEIYVPYFGESLADHKITNSIVLAALRELQAPTIVYEYPIWFWRHWPWASVPNPGWRESLQEIKVSLFSWLTLIRDFRWFVPVGEVLERKRVALNQHQSQMVRPHSSAPWPILSDVSDGEFLACFFREHEYFYKHLAS